MLLKVSLCQCLNHLQYGGSNYLAKFGYSVACRKENHTYFQKAVYRKLASANDGMKLVFSQMMGMLTLSPEKKTIRFYKFRKITTALFDRCIKIAIKHRPKKLHRY